MRAALFMCIATATAELQLPDYDESEYNLVDEDSFSRKLTASYGSYGSYESYGSYDPATPTKASTDAPTKPPVVAPPTSVPGFSSSDAPTAQEITAYLDAQPSTPLTLQPTPAPVPPTAGPDEVVETVDIPVTKITSTLPANAVPIPCIHFDEDSDRGQATRAALHHGVSVSSGVTDLEKITVECLTTVITSEKITAGRQLSENRLLTTSTQYAISVEVPDGDGVVFLNLIKANLQKSAGNGVFLNSIKAKAKEFGVATAELLEAPPVLALELKHEETTKRVQRVVKNPTDAPTKPPTKASTDAPTKPPTKAPTKAPTEAPTKSPSDGLTDGEIAAIVICVLLFFFGALAGLWWCQKNKTESHGVPSGQVEYKLEQTTSASYDV